MLQILSTRLRTHPSLELEPEKHSASQVTISCVIVILIGAMLRCSQYIADRSLWRDEAALALNIVNRSFVGLAQPLDGEQGAPLGFLFGQKLLTVLLGNTDYVLRIIPLISGLASMWTMYALAKRIFLERVAIVAAVVLCAVSVPLIYFASEAKQYSSDVLACLLLLLVIVRDFDRHVSNQEVLLLAALGTVALWVSYPALFILAGAGSTLGVHFILNRDRRSALKLGCVATLWLVSLLLLYFICLRQLSVNRYLLEYWNETFMPLPPWRNWGWFRDTLRSVIADPIGLPVNSTIALVVCGSISICVRRWEFGFMLMLPILWTLVASALRKYPFADRVLLFVTPIMFLIVAEAIGRIYSLLNRFTRLPRVGLAVALAILAKVAITPAYQATILKPHLREEIKPIMSYLSDHRQGNDVVYVYYGAAPAFRYYLPFYRLDKVDVVWGTKHRPHADRFHSPYYRQDKVLTVWKNKNAEMYLRELNKLQSKGRVWIVISDGADEKAFFLDHLDQIGKRLEQFEAQDAWLGLYDLKRDPPSLRSGTLL